MPTTRERVNVGEWVSGCKLSVAFVQSEVEWCFNAFFL